MATLSFHTNRSRFFRGEVDKYTWVDPGSSYVLGELLAVFLLAQLEELDAIHGRRRAVWERYWRHLGGLTAKGVGLPTVPADCEQAYHMFYLITRSRSALPSRTLSSVKSCVL